MQRNNEIIKSRVFKIFGIEIEHTYTNPKLEHIYNKIVEKYCEETGDNPKEIKHIVFIKREITPDGNTIKHGFQLSPKKESRSAEIIITVDISDLN